MNVIPFIAESAVEAVTKIRAELGPEAVVLNVRQLPPDGFSKLWKRPRIEVLTCRPDARPAAPEPDGLLELREEVRVLRQQMPVSPSENEPRRDRSIAAGIRHPPSAIRHPAWRVAEVLEQSGLLPLHAQRVVDELRTRHGENAPPTLAEELVLARQVLLGLWPKLPVAEAGTGGPHVLIGPAGTGKTTCVCKWLAQARLVEGRTAFVWRLDGANANTAESLSVYCEILGVPTERTWSGADPAAGADLSFVDLPGVDWRSPAAVRELARRIEGLGPSRVHLVLNAAYEVPLLLAQMRAFAALPVADMILTHLDEETRWAKIWNIVLGTNVPVSHLSAAQNIPGEFAAATAEKILQHQFAL